MTTLPFPSFVSSPPVADGGAAALPAVGRCRIHPETCSSSAGLTEEYRNIVAKTIEQSSVDDKTAGPDRDNNKKLKKKYMKQGVAMARDYLNKGLGIDTSVVDTEIVLTARDIMDSTGLVASCFLDAGCDKIVVDGTDVAALDTAKIPRERLVAAFDGTVASDAACAAAQLAGTVSIRTNDASAEVLLALIGAMNDVADEGNKFDVSVEVSAGEDVQALAEKIGEVSRGCSKLRCGGIGIIDPTVQQLGMSYAACARTDRDDGLYTTVVCTRSGEALGLVYSSKESIVAALECGRGVYYSRSRNGLWRKGDTSGHYQTLHRIDVDCDADALRFTVTQRGDDVAAFCHLNTLTCWGEPCGIRHLEGTLKQRLKDAPEGSYTKRLFDDDELLRDKLVEEAQELSEANTKEDVAGELADVLYFAMIRAVKAGVSIDDAAAELDRRARKVTRRKGDSKAFRIEAGNKILSK